MKKPASNKGSKNVRQPKRLSDLPVSKKGSTRVKGGAAPLAIDLYANTNMLIQ